MERTPLTFQTRMKRLVRKTMSGFFVNRYAFGRTV
jgi:hypothetical protein